MEETDDHRGGGTHANFTTFASLVSGFLLLSTGFFAGWYWQNASVQDLVQVEIVEGGGQIAPLKAEAAADAPAVLGEETTALIPDNCPFVGSKNSDKYHSPDSAPAKRIKPANRVCFASETEAQEAGYEAGTIK